MILDFARKTYLRTFLLLCITVLLLWVKQLVEPSVAAASSATDMPFMVMLKGFSGTESHLLRDALLISVVTVFSAFLLMFIVAKNDLLRGRNYLVAFIFILYSLAFPSQKIVSGVHFSALLGLISFSKLLTLYDAPRTATAGAIFMACFWIGVAGLIYPPALLFLPIFLVGVALLKVFGWRDFFIATLGVATPLIMASAYFYVADKDFMQVLSVYGTYFTPGQSALLTNGSSLRFNPGYLCLAYLGLLNLIAAFSNARGISANVQTSRMLGILRTSVFVLTAAIVVFPAMQTGQMLTILAISTSVLSASFLSGIRKTKLANILLLLLVASCLSLQFFF